MTDLRQCALTAFAVNTSFDGLGPPASGASGTFGSNHPGGALFGFADDSHVGWIDDTTDISGYRAAINPEGWSGERK